MRDDVCRLYSAEAVENSDMLCNVAYRLVAKQLLGKQRPFLGNGSVNTFPFLADS
jgi:hypothetical protein